MLADRLLLLSQQKVGVFLCNQGEFGKYMVCMAAGWGGQDWPWWWLCSLTVVGKEGGLGAARCRWQNYCAVAGKRQLPACHILIKPQLQAELVQGSLVTPCVTGALMTPDVPAKHFHHVVFSREWGLSHAFCFLYPACHGLCSRVLELIIYVEMVCKASLSWSQGLWQQDLFPFVFDKSALCVHPKLVGGWLSSCVIWQLCFHGILFAEVSWFLYLVVLAGKAFRFVLSRNLDSYWNHFINLK